MLNAYTFALVILFNGAADGGRAINTELRFITLEACQAAAATVAATRTDGSGWKPFATTAFCVSGVQP